MNGNIMSLVHIPEDEVSEDISEQVEVNEVNESSEELSNAGKDADGSATGKAEPPSKRQKADESAAVSCGGRKIYFYSEQIYI